jgi:pilus assembly protein CpaB
MNRSTRTFIVIAIAVVLASVSTYLVYWTIKNRPTREVEVARVYAVVAAHPLSLGASITPADVKLVPWPAASPLPGGFSKTEELTGRGIIAPVAENEPLTGNNVAGKDAGAGLPPTIPVGMRAISVKVNEVIGVAGFVVPGTRVDVMVILKTAAGSLAKVVVSNVQVLAAGTKYDKQVAKEGEAMPASVVTLMVSSEDAERVALASTEGQILLTLRNPLDAVPTTSTGTTYSNLLGQGGRVESASPATPAAPARPRRTVVAAPPPAPPPPPKAYTVEVIRGAKRTEETIK